jgi:hypothetical protein
MAVDDSYTKILLHCDSTGPIVDESGKSWATNGITLDTTTKKFGAGALNFPTAKYLRTDDHADFVLGAGDWTFDTWVYFNSVTGIHYFVHHWDTDPEDEFRIYHSFTAGKLYARGLVAGATQFYYSWDWAPSVSTWYHLEVSRYGNACIALIDGDLKAATEITTISGKTLPDIAAIFYIGSQYNYQYYLLGKLDEVRLSVGICRHTEDFTPATGPYIPPLAIANASQVQTADNLTLTAYGGSPVLVIANAIQAQSAGSVALVQHNILSAAGAVQAQTAGGIALVQHNVLVVGDPVQAQATCAVDLTQHNILSGADAAQAQFAGAVELVQHNILAVADSAQSQNAGSPDLVQHFAPLEVQNVIQGQVVSTLALVQHHTLAVVDTTQQQTADNVTLVIQTALIVAIALQLQRAENVDLIQHHVLDVNDARQSQSAGNVVLCVAYPQGNRTIYQAAARVMANADGEINKSEGGGIYGNVPRSNYSAKHR